MPDKPLLLAPGLGARLGVDRVDRRPLRDDQRVADDGPPRVALVEQLDRGGEDLLVQIGLRLDTQDADALAPQGRGRKLRGVDHLPERQLLRTLIVQIDGHIDPVLVLDPRQQRVHPRRGPLHVVGLADLLDHQRPLRVDLHRGHVAHVALRAVVPCALDVDPALDDVRPEAQRDVLAHHQQRVVLVLDVAQLVHLLRVNRRTLDRGIDEDHLARRVELDRRKHAVNRSDRCFTVQSCLGVEQHVHVPTVNGADLTLLCFGELQCMFSFPTSEFPTCKAYHVRMRFPSASCDGTLAISMRFLLNP